MATTKSGEQITATINDELVWLTRDGAVIGTGRADLDRA